MNPTPRIAFALSLLAATGAFAQAYPNKPIRLIVPFPPGGANDIAARVLNTRLPALLGQNLLIDNRPGAGGNIGAELTAKSPADGYTLLAANNSLITNASLYRKLPYEPFRDFVSIAMIATSPNMVVSHPQLPARSVKELVALARANPGQITYASPGPGTSSHLAGELFRVRTGTNMLHVPYKGAGPLVIDQVGGHVILSFTAPIVSKPHIDAGKLRAIAVTSEKRWQGLPDVPAISETLPGYEARGWNGILAPAETPKMIIEQLNREIVKIARSPEFAQVLTGEGATAVGNSPAEFEAIIRADIRKWAKIIKDNGIRQ